MEERELEEQEAEEHDAARAYTARRPESTHALFRVRAPYREAPIP